ncbi:uncharacterized protein Dwil_GK23884 [Drosophila willistoni]|uniref:Uncharacterized protein n=1 Tax=Drosophila willistoni TaxID=7260 RepID=B4N6X1_DROWI|nr:peptidoglycan-recognition protein SD [Drosophila willistoni]EDW80110.2 uncharacterized protein Dwil_GK23884 [Drosophila willistoni]
MMYGWRAVPVEVVVVLIGILSFASGDGEVPVQVVTRTEWQARPSNGSIGANELPLSRAVIAHTAGVRCKSDEACIQQVRSLQQYQMDTLGFSDIGYHYLIGDNGRAYEGRSPSQRASFAGRNNGGSLAIAFIGNFDEELPTEGSLETAKSLIQQSVQQKNLAENYELFGHRQVSATKSPGDALFAQIKQWPNWSNKSLL